MLPGRAQRTGYCGREGGSDSPEWQDVRQVVADRQQEDQEGTFAARVAGLRTDVVVDLVCFTLEGTKPVGECGVQKDRIARMLNEETASGGLVLGYAPRYEPEQAVLESVRWLIENNELRVATPLTVRAG
jgi:hypothetical protein